MQSIFIDALGVFDVNLSRIPSGIDSSRRQFLRELPQKFLREFLQELLCKFLQGFIRELHQKFLRELLQKFLW